MKATVGTPLAVAVALVLASCSSGDDASPSDSQEIDIVHDELGHPGEVSLPPATDPAAVAAWFEGEGRPALALVTETEVLVVGGPDDCEVTAAALDETGSPADLLAAASATPDATTAEILVSLHSTIGRALAACSNRSEFDGAHQDLAWQWQLASRQLGESGVDL